MSQAKHDISRVKYNISAAEYEGKGMAGKTKVSMTPEAAKFVKGTQVTFEGSAGTAIKFTNGSPFEENLHDKVVPLPAGPYTVKSATVRYRFECGRLVQRNGQSVFEPWTGGGETPLDH